MVSDSILKYVVYFLFGTIGCIIFLYYIDPRLEVERNFLLDHVEYDSRYFFLSDWSSWWIVILLRLSHAMFLAILVVLTVDTVYQIGKTVEQLLFF